MATVGCCCLKLFTHFEHSLMRRFSELNVLYTKDLKKKKIAG